MASVLNMEEHTTTKITLNNGIRMPAVGLGTFRVRNDVVIMKAVDAALEAGYRLFDTAAVYHNEAHLNKAFKALLPKYGLEREDIFVTTKLAPSNHGDQDTVQKAFEQSLNNLGFDYVDLFLIHFPGSQRISHNDPRNTILRKMSWESLHELYDDGRVNAIGVSNYTVRHLKELLQSDHDVVPAVNQVEWHPYYYQTDLLNLCQQNDIAIQAYCSLGGTSLNNFDLYNDPVVSKIANKLEVTNAQVLLKWAVQQDVCVIPKSTTPEHIKKNISLNFVIPSDDIQALNELGPNKIKYAWDPSVVV